MWLGVSVLMAALCLCLLLLWLGSPLTRFNVSRRPRQPLAFSLVWPWVEALVPVASRFMSWNLRHRLARFLQQAGTDSFESPQHFFALQCVLAMATAGLVVLALAQQLPVPAVAMIAAFTAASAAWWPVDFLRRQAMRRQRAMLRIFPFLLDMVTLCVEAGLNLQSALRQVAEKGPDGPLREEIRHLLADIRAGASRQDALGSWAQRCDLAQVQQFVAAVLQAEMSGMSLGPVLRAHADQWRSDSFLRAEKQALEAPVKLMFPLVFCIFPCSFLIIAFPLAIQFLELLE